MTLDLSLDEINQVLLGLAKLPFEQVNTLIPKIQEQGRSQLTPPAPVEKAEVEIV